MYPSACAIEEPPDFSMHRLAVHGDFRNLFSRPRASFSVEFAFLLDFSWGLPAPRWVMICTGVILRGRQKEQRNDEQHARLFTQAICFLGDLCRRDFLLAERTRPFYRSYSTQKWNTRNRSTVLRSSDDYSILAGPRHSQRHQVAIRQIEERTGARRHD